MESFGLAGLFASSFLSATLLPGNSELVLVALLRAWPQLQWPAILIATLGNTLGGLTSYLVGRLVPRAGANRAYHVAHRYGPPMLLLSWVPVIGDGLCMAAGWLRQNVAAVVLFMGVGKLARYVVVVAGLESFRG